MYQNVKLIKKLKREDGKELNLIKLSKGLTVTIDNYSIAPMTIQSLNLINVSNIKDACNWKQFYSNPVKEFDLIEEGLEYLKFSSPNDDYESVKEWALINEYI
ncbi:hypothetical protein [Chengkuizengella marina]|uniref:Uncharacterized protein n=1 Tax=Chengkuizengella marina TaxID=2507566 RepID=A0A6N9Q104_9BACL|nr:hypothetical protein [Chengkuizengella marina]NBI28635.1 hypothetical protein [Chengkuizengella marina]